MNNVLQHTNTFFSKSFIIFIQNTYSSIEGCGSGTGVKNSDADLSHDPNGVTCLAGFRHPTKPWSNCCCEFIESKLLTLFASDRVCWGHCHCCHQELHDSQQEHTLGRHLKNDITIEVKPDEFYRTARYIIRIIWIGLEIPSLKLGYSG